MALTLSSKKRGAVPLPALPVLAADTPVMQKVRLAQVSEGLAYLDYVKDVIRIGSWNAEYLDEYTDMATEVFRVAADLEESPAKRVPWY